MLIKSCLFENIVLKILVSGKLLTLASFNTRLFDTSMWLTHSSSSLCNLDLQLWLFLQASRSESDMRDIAARICRDYLTGAWKTIPAEDLQLKRISGGLSNFLYYVGLPDQQNGSFPRPSSNCYKRPRKDSYSNMLEPKEVSVWRVENLFLFFFIVLYIPLSLRVLKCVITFDAFKLENRKPQSDDMFDVS